MKARELWIAALAVLACQGAPALTWGEVQGRAWIGRGLELVVPARLEAVDDVTDTCFRVLLSHGDVLQPRVQLHFDSSLPGLRIRSDAPVDEPLIHLELQSLCGARATRRYVLLADLPPAPGSAPAASASQRLELPRVDARGTMAEALSAAPPLAAAAAIAATGTRPGTASPAAAVSAPKPAASQSLAAAASAPLPAAKASAPVAKRAKPAARSAVSGARAAAKAPASRRDGKAVLRLDPLEQFSDRIDKLDAALVFAPPEDALRQQALVASLEKDVKTLKETVTRNGIRLADLQAQLQLAQQNQTPREWLWAALALAGVSLAALAGVLWWQRRQRGQARAWHESEFAPPDTVLMPQPADSTLPGALDDLPARPAAAATPGGLRTAPSTPAPAPTASAVDAAAAATPLSPAPQPPAAVSTPTPPTAIELAQTGLGAAPSFSVEPILDIRQQAEFFVSLGQTERALRVLKKQIADSPVPNPVIYLDLLSLFHSLGYKADFREYRKAFNQHFNGVMPDFPAFHLEGQDLLAYPDVLAELQTHWPSAKTLAFLNECVFHDPNNPVRPTYDLAAFKDLLMLHALVEAVAEDLPPPQPMDAPLSDAELMALDAPVAPATATAPRAAPLDRPGVDPFGLPSVDPVSLHADRVLDVPGVRRASPMAAFPSQPAKPPEGEETPSRMLDLDFSTLDGPAPAPMASGPQDPPAKGLPFDAGDARWKVVKKP